MATGNKGLEQRPFGIIKIAGVGTDIRHPLVETAISSFHVEYRDLAAFGRQHDQAGIGVTQNSTASGLALSSTLSLAMITRPMVSPAGSPAAFRN